METELIIWAQEAVLGRVTTTPSSGGQLAFHYDPAWLADPLAFPLSLSLPMRAGNQDHNTIHAFLDGLISDNRKHRENLGKSFGVPPRNPFALLTHIGRDCSGGIQFIPSGEFDHWRAYPYPAGLAGTCSKRAVLQYAGSRTRPHDRKF